MEILSRDQVSSVQLCYLHYLESSNQSNLEILSANEFPSVQLCSPHNLEPSNDSYQKIFLGIMWEQVISVQLCSPHYLQSYLEILSGDQVTACLFNKTTSVSWTYKPVVSGDTFWGWIIFSTTVLCTLKWTIKPIISGDFFRE